MNPKLIKLFGKKRTRLFLFSVLFLVVAVAVAVGLGYRSIVKPDKETLLKIIPDNVDLQIKNFHFTEVGDANWKWEINADTAQYVKKDNLAYFTNVKMRIIRSDGKTVTISGDKGRLRTDTKNATISGHVLVVTSRGDEVTTDKLNYTDAEKKIFTEDPITFKNPQLEIRASGMTLLIAKEKITLNDHVKAVYTR